MKSLYHYFQSSHLKNFNQTVWAMLIGGLAVRITYFMSWPFLIIVLNNQSMVSPIGIGVILGFSAGVSALSGIYIGYLSDKWGRKPILLIGCLLGIACYLSLIFATQFWHFFGIMAALGLVRPMVEVVTKSIICDNIAHAKTREFALYLRYFFINIAGAIGPIIGLWFGLKNAETLFLITSIAYLCYFLWIFKLIAYVRHHSNTKPPNFSQTLSVIIHDKLFLVLIITLFLILLIYSQANATLPQILTQNIGDNAAQLIVWLTVINCLTVVILQFPLLKLLDKLPLIRRTQIGIGFLLLSQLLFWATNSHDMWVWCIIFFVFSVGEVIVFPTMSVHIDNFAKPELRGSYFGAGALGELGSAVGPILGAWIISQYSDNHYFALMSIFCVICIFLYIIIDKRTHKNS